MSQLILKRTYGQIHLVRREADMAETNYHPICRVTPEQAAGIATWGVPALLMNDLPDAAPLPLVILRNPDFMKDATPWRLMAGDEEIARIKDASAAWLHKEGVTFPEPGEPNPQRRALEDAELHLAQKQNELEIATRIRDRAAARVEELRSRIEDNGPSAGL